MVKTVAQASRSFTRNDAPIASPSVKLWEKSPTRLRRATVLHHVRKCYCLGMYLDTAASHSLVTIFGVKVVVLLLCSLVAVSMAVTVASVHTPCDLFNHQERKDTTKSKQSDP